MSELKHLSNIYEQASPELKAHPAFLSKLEEIDKLISVVKGGGSYKYSYYEAGIKDGKVEIEIYTSYLSDGRGLEDGGRILYLCDLGLNEKGDLVSNVNSGQGKNNKDSYGSSISLDTNQEIIAKGTKNVIYKKQTRGFEDKETPVDFKCTPPKQQEVFEVNTLKQWDRGLMTHLKVAQNNLMTYTSGYEQVEIKRSQNDPQKAYVSLDIYQGIYNRRYMIPVYNKEMPLTGPDYSVMRVDHIERFRTIEAYEKWLESQKESYGTTPKR